MIAIVIPYYKRNFFSKTLDSLACQTDKRFKVYIGDDASSEKIDDLLQDYNGKFSFSFRRFESNLGSLSLTRQWERCIALSLDEPWIMVLGDDDWISNNLVESFYSYKSEFDGKTSLVRFAKQNVRVLQGDARLENNRQENPIWESAATALYRRITGGTTITLSEYIFRREVYEKYKFHDYPKAWHSDNRAWIEFSENKPIYSINDAFVTVVHDENSITGSKLHQSEKKLASIQFYRYIIQEKLSFFDRNQAIRVLHKYENSLKNMGGIRSSDYFFLFKYYLKKFKWLPFKAYIKKMIKAIFKLG